MAAVSAGPEVWAAEVLPRVFRNDLHAPEPGPRHLVTLPELLADDAARLRQLHTQLTGEGATPQAAAHYLVGWFPGLIATAIGYGMATTGAGIVLEPHAVRFEVVTEGWPESLHLVGPSAVIPTGHPWDGCPLVTTVPGGTDEGASAVAAATLTGLTDLVAPFVEACHGFAKTRISSLWNEVADGLGHAVAHQRHLIVTPRMLVDLDRLLTQPEAPWNRRPRLGWTPSATLGPVHVAQKGGCCLAFTERPPDPDAAPSDGDTSSNPDVGTLENADADVFTAHVAAYREQFPEHLDLKRYCSTCRFRDPSDVDARQLFWAERRPTT